MAEYNPGLIQDINLEFPYQQQICGFSLQLDLNEYSQKAMWIYFNKGQLYEPETSRLFCLLLQPGDSVIDVGGHIGYFSLMAAAVTGTSGHVYTFEPETANYQHLLKNIERNPFKNIHVFHEAAGDCEKDVTFYINADNDGGHALWDVSRHDFNELSRDQMHTRTVHQTTLGIALKDQLHTPLRLIKMDVEGCELKVMQGAKQLLIDNNYPFVIAEVNRFAMRQMHTNEAELRRFMSSMGYQAYYPEENSIIALAEDQFIESEYVFNLLFALPKRLDTTLQQLLPSQMPS